VQIGERLRAELDPDQFDQFGIGMDHALDAMGDRGRVRGENLVSKRLMRPGGVMARAIRTGRTDRAGGLHP